MTLGQRIQEQRKKLNLSQEALGEAMGVSRQAISKWEGDLTIPEIDKLIGLSKLFGVSLNQLLGVEEPTPAADPGREKRTRRWLAGLTALCLVLAVATGVLWSQLGRLNRISVAEEKYVDTNRTLFESAQCELSDIELGFLKAKGEEDLKVDMTLRLVQAMKGWEVLGVRANITGFDPWGQPDGTWGRDLRDRVDVKAEKDFLGPWRASFTLPDYGGQEVSIDVIFREKKTGREFQAFKVFSITPGIEELRVTSLQAETLPVGYWAVLPASLALELPENDFGEEPENP